MEAEHCALFSWRPNPKMIYAASLPALDGGRLRVWRTLTPLPASPPSVDFGGSLGDELLECVPEGLVVCDGGARVLWAGHGAAGGAARAGGDWEVLRALDAPG